MSIVLPSNTTDRLLQTLSQNVSDIRAIRSMSIEKVFENKYEAAVQQAYVGGARAAPFTGFGYALGSSLTYFAEGRFSEASFAPCG